MSGRYKHITLNYIYGTQEKLRVLTNVMGNDEGRPRCRGCDIYGRRRRTTDSVFQSVHVHVKPIRPVNTPPGRLSCTKPSGITPRTALHLNDRNASLGEIVDGRDDSVRRWLSRADEQVANRAL